MAIFAFDCIMDEIMDKSLNQQVTHLSYKMSDELVSSFSENKTEVPRMFVSFAHFPGKHSHYG